MTGGPVSMDEVPTGSARTWDRPDVASLDLPAVMGYIRDRCPWASAHTHHSLQKFLLEETHELLAALDHGERTEIENELGDVLYQVLFHASLIDEAAGEPGSGAAFRRVQEGLRAKLVRRHPHVFDSDGPVPIDEVERRYEAVKAAERAEKVAGTSAAEAPSPSADTVASRLRQSFDSVPRSVPALSRAHAVLDRVERLEARNAPIAGVDLGERLLALVAEAKEAGIDPEAALRNATEEHERRTVEVNTPEESHD
ncbi:MazG nucleotide pyrophosphohydrolase domain-containing protein [Brevibacterium litoralis]|uniref:MazG nucleotide pyrophosphohydrolase domain-containing protein n=1 Tax=Brevibacterium litoralis TaxID=3138935 RepID=UPI0032EB2BDD